MDTAAVLEGLVSFAEADWIALWMIVDDVEAELSPDDDEETLEITLTLVKGLVERGLLAGDSPVASGRHFTVWSNQDPSAIGRYIRRQWTERGGPPGWGDGPWFATPALARRHA
jgi:hypothetical protein